MSGFFGLTDFLGSHPQLAFAAVLLLALSEALPVLGTVVPGSTLILAISTVATAADVKPWILLLAAVIGAVAGDGLAFWLGYRYHREILRGWPLNRFPGLIARSAQFIRRHGALSVFLARFAAIVRAFVPIIAGVLRMPSRHFYAANILSALVWAPLHIFPGVLAGMAISVAGPHGAELAVAVFFLLVLASMGWHLVKRRSHPVSDATAFPEPARDLTPPRSGGDSL
jgi:membrane protein DedA with SNARE-associated domain